MKRIETELIERGMGPFSQTAIHVTPPPGVETPECVMRLSVRHEDRKALQFFALEIATAGTSMAPGIQALGGGR